MSFKRVKDRGSKRTSTTIDRFEGSHYGVGKADQWKGYGYVSDFNFLEGKMSVRQGAIKNADSGKSSSIESVFNVRIGSSNRIGVIHNGTMDLQDVNTSVDSVVSVRDWDLYYPFTTNSNDFSGNGYDGTDTDMSYTGEVAVFDGLTSRIKIPDAADVWGGASSWAVGMWFKATAFVDGDALLGHWGNAGSRSIWLELMSNPTVRLRYTLDGTQAVFNASYLKADWVAGTWYYLTLSFEGTELSLYVDGVLDRTLDLGGVIFEEDATNIYLGRRLSGSFYEGSLDTVMFWDRSLSADEVKFVYDNYKHS